MLAAGIIFVLAFVGILLLFAVKYWELARNRELFPALRRKGDARALQVKGLALAAREDVTDLLPHVVRIARFAIHEAALGFAALARFSEQQAHRLADMVSHKRGFERRETRSEFLRKVAEHKQSGLDGGKSNGQNI